MFVSKLRVYKTLTLVEKVTAILEVEKGIKKSQIVKDFGIPLNTLKK